MLRAAAGAVGGTALAAQSPTLYAPAAAEFGGPVHELRGADLDGDGRDDLVALLKLSSALNVALATGGGAFGAPQSVALGGLGGTCALADFDGDGDVDAAVALPSGSLVSLLANDGAGGLTTAGALTSFAGAGTLRVADFEGDGDVDALVHTSAPFQFGYWIGWWVASGAGAFGSLHTLAQTEPPALSALGDVDNDGLLELATLRNDVPAPPLRVRHFVPGVGFGAAISSDPFGSGVTQPGRIALADLDLDGDDDLVATAKYGSFVYSSASDGSGLFGRVVSANIGDGGIGLAVADFDGDGWPDVASATSSGLQSSFNTLWGGSSGPTGIGKHYGIGFPDPADLATGDWNGDGWLDVAVAGAAVGRASIHPNVGARDFADVDFPPAFLAAQSDVACVDWNLDGAADVATTTASPLVFVYAGDGNGGQVPAVSPSVPAAGVRVAAGDLDGSGRPDFVHLAADGALQVILSSGPGAFAAALDVGSTSLASDLALADVNLDGRLDIVTSGLGGARVFAGNGDGTLAAPTTIALGAAGCDRVAIADFELNGLPDLAGLAVGSAAIGIATGAGAGTFGAPKTVGFGAPLADFTVGHLDQDNKIDIVASADGPSGVWVAQNDTTGAMLAPVPFALPGGGASPKLFDANADGFADLVYIEPVSRSPRLALGNGQAQFTNWRALAESPELRNLALADLDADGRCEIVGGGDRVGIWRAFAPPPAGTSPFGIGTSGCLGRMGMVAGSEPKLGSAKFDLSISNIGAGHGGFLVLAFAPDVGGSLLQPFGILVHVNLAGSFVYGAHGSGGPTGRWKAAIPGDAGLAGLQLVFQAAWPWTPLSPCDPSPFLLSTSRGLAVTLLP